MSWTNYIIGTIWLHFRSHVTDTRKVGYTVIRQFCKAVRAMFPEVLKKGVMIPIFNDKFDPPFI